MSRIKKWINTRTSRIEKKNEFYSRTQLQFRVVPELGEE